MICFEVIKIQFMTEFSKYMKITDKVQTLVLSLIEAQFII